jgi:hypothetical protein
VLGMRHKYQGDWLRGKCQTPVACSSTRFMQPISICLQSLTRAGTHLQKTVFLPDPGCLTLGLETSALDRIPKSSSLVCPA